MTTKFSKGDNVFWKWASGEAQGTIKEIHNSKITKTIKGSEITRDGSSENPALVIEHENSVVLKLASEVHKK